MGLRCLLGLIWMVASPADGWCVNVVWVWWLIDVGTLVAVAWAGVSELQLFQVETVCVGIAAADCELMVWLIVLL